MNEVKLMKLQKTYTREQVREITKGYEEHLKKAERQRDMLVGALAESRVSARTFPSTKVSLERECEVIRKEYNID